MRIFNLNRCLKVLFVILFVVSTAALSHGATTLGTLAGNETWSGTVTLTGDVTVPVGVTLTIEPGTEVVFPKGSDDTGGGDEAGLTELIINGSFSAVGTESSKIVFKSDAFFPSKGDWGGIRATWGLGLKTLDMQHCVISHASTGIRWHVQGGVQSATISNCTVEETSGIGIYIFGESGADISITIDNNSILDNDSHGIYTYVNGSSSTLGGTINGNTISDSGGYGGIAFAYTNAVSTVTVNDNDISNSGHAGVYVYGYDSGQANVTIRGGN